MLIEALRGEAASPVNTVTNRVAFRRRFTRVAVSAAIVATGAATLLFAGGATRADAQTLDTGEQRDFAVKVGVFIPAEKYVRTASATTIPMVEADYTIQKYPESRFNSVLSVGYLEHERFRMIPITVSQIYRDPENAAGVNYYYGLGVGLYETRLNLDSSNNYQSKGLVGGFAVAGLDFTKTIFAEAKYHLISRYNGSNVNGFQLTAGLRF